MEQELKSLIAEEVERAIENTDIYSRQPRFDTEKEFMASFFDMTYRAELDTPAYVPDSRKRDGWLSKFARSETHLIGVINGVIANDKNRGWSLTGGKRQVGLFSEILHSADAFKGWREFISRQAFSFYTTDLGAVAEIGRVAQGGPMAGVYHVDSTRCQLTNNWLEPLRYYPARGKKQTWAIDDFYQCTSLPNPDETYNGLGYCAVSRCLELAKMMYAIWAHDQEMLAARPPKGFLIINGIGEKAYQEAMAKRKEQASNDGQTFYTGVARLMSEAGKSPIDAKLVALSQMPANLDLDSFVHLLMYGYSLAFGYDVSEFYPLKGGSFGRGSEAQVQSQKATSKGELDFVLLQQHGIQRFLPESLMFEFDQRDDKGDVIRAALAKAREEVINAMYTKQPRDGDPLIDREEGRQLLAESQLIPYEWTEAEEDVQADDTGKERLLDNPQVQRAIALSPKEPIVRYQWPTNRMQVLWESGEDAIHRRSYPVAKVRAVLLDEDDVTITDKDVNKAVKLAGERVSDVLADMLEAEGVDA